LDRDEPLTRKQVYIAGERPFHKYRVELIERGLIFDGIRKYEIWRTSRAEAVEWAKTIADIWLLRVFAVRRLPDARG